MGKILKGALLRTVFVSTTCFLILLALVKKTDGDLENILESDERVILIKPDPGQNIQFTSIDDYLASKNLSTSFLKDTKGNELTLLSKIENFVFGEAEKNSEIQNWLISLKNVGTLSLEQAIEDRNGALVKLLVRLGADVNEKNELLETPLHRASASIDKAFALKFSKFLIDSGADAYAQDKHNRTFLHNLVDLSSPGNPAQQTNLQSNGTVLSSSGFLDITQYLIRKGLFKVFNKRENNLGKTPLMLAARSVELDLVTISLLESKGVDLFIVDENGASYLSHAAKGNKNSKLLTEIKSNIKHLNLSEAIRTTDEHSVKVLVWLGADVNKTNDELKSPLHLSAEAASKNRTFALNVIKFLINAGAHAYAKDGDKLTFLHRLVQYSRINPTQLHEMATFLISRDLSQLFNTPGGFQGATPMHLAVHFMKMDRATLPLLNKNGVDFDAVDDEGWSILYFAIWGDRTVGFISDLVALGANPDHLTIDGESMLHMAAGQSNLDAIKLFLEHGLDVNAQDYKGETPLHRAIWSPKNNVFETVQILLRNGANGGIANDDGKTPIDLFNESRRIYSEADRISTCFSLGSSC